MQKKNGEKEAREGGGEMRQRRVAAELNAVVRENDWRSRLHEIKGLIVNQWCIVMGLVL